MHLFFFIKFLFSGSYNCLWIQNRYWDQFFPMNILSFSYNLNIWYQHGYFFFQVFYLWTTQKIRRWFFNVACHFQVTTGTTSHITAVPRDIGTCLRTAKCKRKSDEPQQIYYNALNTRIPNIPLIRWQKLTVNMVHIYILYTHQIHSSFILRNNSVSLSIFSPSVYYPVIAIYKTPIQTFFFFFK